MNFFKSVEEEANTSLEVAIPPLCDIIGSIYYNFYFEFKYGKLEFMFSRFPESIV